MFSKCYKKTVREYASKILFSVTEALIFFSEKCIGSKKGVKSQQ